MILKTDLEPWEVNAVDKLKHIKIGALYMEQGTGKTRTALELIKKRVNDGKVNKILWLCPCSVKSAIEDEFVKHIYKGSEQIRIEGIESLSNSVRLNCDLLDLVKNNDTYLIVDEGNLVKNHRANRTENIIRLAENCKYKLLLNGTPISKNEKDLFSQWYILDWRILGYKSFWSFSANHIEWDDNIPGKVRRVLNTDYLVRKIAPYTYQVTKDELIKQGYLFIPEKDYSTRYYSLTDEQMEEYDRVADVFLMQLDELKPTTIYRLFTALQHVIGGNKIVSHEYEKIKIEPMFKDPYKNPRIRLLLNAISRYNGDKVIIWAKHTQEINNIAYVLKNEYGYNSAVEFYGKIKSKERIKNIKEFEGNVQFFIGNKTCAGYGLNLQFCHNSIYYSNDWDYATRSQSEDRLHRIGQENEVNIEDICANNTLDLRILRCLRRKENLIDNFKKQINIQKDKKEFLSNWLRCKEDICERDAVN